MVLGACVTSAAATTVMAVLLPSSADDDDSVLLLPLPLLMLASAFSSSSQDGLVSITMGSVTLRLRLCLPEGEGGEEEEDSLQEDSSARTVIPELERNICKFKMSLPSKILMYSIYFRNSYAKCSTQ